MIVTRGASTTINGSWHVVQPSTAQGGEYIYHFQAPRITFSVISPDTILYLLDKLIALKNVADGNGMDIEGASVDTETGNIFVRVRLTPTKPKTVTINGVEYPDTTSQAGVNPIAVIAVIGTVFASLAIAVTLLYVYGQAADPKIDPCTESGILPFVVCTVNRAGWVLVGVGIAAVLILLLVAKKTISE